MMDPASGEVFRFFGDYLLLGDPMEGSMSWVYRARHLSSNRLVALKKLKKTITIGEEGKGWVHRFRVGAEAAGRLDHPNIVRIYEVGECDGEHFVSMELINGVSLAERLAGRAMPVRDAVSLVAKIARAVALSHERGVLHQDLKPANILVDEQGEPHVTDFGPGGILEMQEEAVEGGSARPGGGSNAYEIPEVTRGARLSTAAADIFSLGAILQQFSF